MGKSAAITNIPAIIAIMTLGFALFGFDISSISGVIGTPQYTEYFNNPLTWEQGGITCSMAAGSFLGSFISSYMGDRWGRRVACQMACGFWIVGATIQCASQNVGMLIAGRLIAGICVGICTPLVPTYLAEISPKEIRGRIIACEQMVLVIGVVVQYYIQYGTSFIKSTASFRIPWGTQMVPAFIMIIGAQFCPKSPRWLASKDRWDEALQVLADLHGKGDTKHPKVLAELKEIEDQQFEDAREGDCSWAELLHPGVKKRVFVAWSIQSWCQLSGSNVMFYYVVYVLAGSGITNPVLIGSISNVINMVCTVPALFLMDVVGRRMLFLTGSTLMAIFLFLVGGLEAAYGHPNPNKNEPNSWVVPSQPAVSKAIATFSFLFVATFAMTWGPATSVYPPEIFRSRHRAKAMSVGAMANWSWNVLLGLFVPVLIHAINWKMYMLFGALNVCAFVQMFFMTPETKLRTLEEMDEIFSVPAWKSAGLKKDRLDELAREIQEGKVELTTVKDPNFGMSTHREYVDQTKI